MGKEKGKAPVPAAEAAAAPAPTTTCCAAPRRPPPSLPRRLLIRVARIGEFIAEVCNAIPFVPLPLSIVAAYYLNSSVHWLPHSYLGIAFFLVVFVNTYDFYDDALTPGFSIIHALSFTAVALALFLYRLF